MAIEQPNISLTYIIVKRKKHLQVQYYRSLKSTTMKVPPWSYPEKSVLTPYHLLKNWGRIIVKEDSTFAIADIPAKQNPATKDPSRNCQRKNYAGAGLSLHYYTELNFGTAQIVNMRPGCQEVLILACFFLNRSLFWKKKQWTLTSLECKFFPVKVKPFHKEFGAHVSRVFL